METTGKGKYSLSARAKSFRHAFNGIGSIVAREPHARIHLVATIVVIAAGLFFHVSRIEACLLALSVGIVWTAEMFNTCLEKLIDFISLEEHPGIKFIKDVAAGAVLVSAAAALTTGLFIFIPKII
jgi:diacylglycerol kinase